MIDYMVNEVGVRSRLRSRVTLQHYKGFENWPQWADLTQTMLEEKEVWDVVDGTRAEPTTAPQIGKKEKDNAVASKIIKQGVSSDLYTNIIRKRNPQRYWETLRRIYS